MCLVCGANVAVIKEYNLRWHYETKHQDKYKNLDLQQKLQKVEKLKKSLLLRQFMFTKAKQQSEATMKASFIVTGEIANSAWPFTEGGFLKCYMMKVSDVLCPDQKQVFSNVSLSRNVSLPLI